MESSKNKRDLNYNVKERTDNNVVTGSNKMTEIQRPIYVSAMDDADLLRFRSIELKDNTSILAKIVALFGG